MDQSLTYKKIIKTWWPLAASWISMALAEPAVGMLMARLKDAKINLAAYGGIVHPISLLVEAPIIMLLAASTALSVNKQSYQKLNKFMLLTGLVLTSLHILIAFTPLYFIVVRSILHVPEIIIEPGRIGLMIMTPWTWAIAYRRLNQGVLIRNGHSKSVGSGTVIRLVTLVGVLIIGYSLKDVSGIVVVTAAQIAGVVIEAAFIGIMARPVIRKELISEPDKPVISNQALIKFYTPLALTSLLNMVWEPICSAALSRMPMALESLAVWPVVFGFIFIFRSTGIAYNEVVVALIGEDHNSRKLKQFAKFLWLGITISYLITALTPLATIWFRDIAAISMDLITIAKSAFLLGLPLGFMSVFQSLYQGSLVHNNQTNAVSEAVGISLLALAMILTIGVMINQITGLYIAMIAYSMAAITQVGWMNLRINRYRRRTYRFKL
jgi:hypothetical protein